MACASASALAQRAARSLVLTNHSDDPMPTGLGLHPYFRRRPETVLRFAADNKLLTDDELLPTGSAHRRIISRIGRQALNSSADGGSLFCRMERRGPACTTIWEPSPRQRTAHRTHISTRPAMAALCARTGEPLTPDAPNRAPQKNDRPSPLRSFAMIRIGWLRRAINFPRHPIEHNSQMVDPEVAMRSPNFNRLLPRVQASTRIFFHRSSGLRSLARCQINWISHHDLCVVSAGNWIATISFTFSREGQPLAGESLYSFPLR